MKAIGSATGSSPVRSNKIKAAVEALAVSQGLGGLLKLTGADDVQASPEITALLGNLEGKGTANRVTKRGLYYGGY